MPDLDPTGLIAEAMVAQLNSATLSQVITAERVPLIRFELKDTGPLKVQILCAADEGEAGECRGETKHEYEAIIAVVRQVQKIENEFIDPLKFLVDEVAWYWATRKLEGREERWLTTEIVPYPADNLSKHNLFISVVKLTFYGDREHA